MKTWCFERDAFTDLIRLSARTGRVPSEIPAHYWRNCWHARRAHMGNKTPVIGFRESPKQIIYMGQA